VRNKSAEVLVRDGGERENDVRVATNRWTSVDFPIGRILIFGNDELLRSRLAAALASSGYASVEASLDGELLGHRAGENVPDLPIHLVVVLVSDDPGEALEMLRSLRGVDRQTPIVAVASEAAYFDLWPHTAELEIATCFTERLDAERFVEAIDGLLPGAD
jgi:DNA-binding NarL/FixJ family response regulator